MANAGVVAQTNGVRLYHPNGDEFGGGTLTDRSGTITTGFTAQQAAAANTSRHYLFIQNPSTAPGSLWFSTVATAVAASPSIELVPGASYETGSFVPTGAVSVIAATTGHAFTAREG